MLPRFLLIFGQMPSSPWKSPLTSLPKIPSPGVPDTPCPALSCPVMSITASSQVVLQTSLRSPVLVLNQVGIWGKPGQLTTRLLSLWLLCLCPAGVSAPGRHRLVSCLGHCSIPRPCNSTRQRCWLTEFSLHCLVPRTLPVPLLPQLLLPSMHPKSYLFVDCFTSACPHCGTKSYPKQPGWCAAHSRHSANTY